MRDPVVKFLEKLAEFRSMKSHMDRRNYKEVIAKFLSVICQKDHDQAKATNQQIPNNPNLKTKREQIFEELNQMIAYMKRLEFEIKRLLDTPVKMFKILCRASSRRGCAAPPALTSSPTRCQRGIRALRGVVHM